MRTITSLGGLLTLVLAIVAGLSSSLDAAAPVARSTRLSPRDVAALIDRDITTKLVNLKIQSGPLADDSEFLRRVHLDLTGRIPRADSVKAFLANKDPEKRAKLIDALLATPEFAQHFARLWARLIAAEEPPQRPILEKWLTTRFRANRPWSDTVTVLLTATGKGPETGFVLSNVENRVPQPNKLAGSAARLFLGVQLQCAECHKHPFASWSQDDFWGIAAFFGKTRIQNKTEPKGVAEFVLPVKGKASKAIKVKGPAIALPSTAGKGAGRVVAAKFLGGKQPTMDDKKAFRPALAAWLTSKDNLQFARATVNRTWHRLFGRGLVNPVDDMHEENPATHPTVLRTLAEEFAASGHDLKHLIRCICNSKAYQRTSRGGAADGSQQEVYARMSVKVMTPDALYESLCLAMGVKELRVDDTASLSSGRGGKRSAARETPRDKFLKAFNTADPDTTPTEFTHGIPQALSLLNEPQLNADSPLLAEIRKKTSADVAIDELFLAVLSRHPKDTERKKIAAYIAKRSSAAKGYADVLWVLLNSPEFVLIP